MAVWIASYTRMRWRTIQKETLYNRFSLHNVPLAKYVIHTLTSKSLNLQGRAPIVTGHSYSGLAQRITIRMRSKRGMQGEGDTTASTVEVCILYTAQQLKFEAHVSWEYLGVGNSSQELPSQGRVFLNEAVWLEQRRGQQCNLLSNGGWCFQEYPFSFWRIENPSLNIDEPENADTERYTFQQSHSYAMMRDFANSTHSTQRRDNLRLISYPRVRLEWLRWLFPSPWTRHPLVPPPKRLVQEQQQVG